MTPIFRLGSCRQALLTAALVACGVSTSFAQQSLTIPSTSVQGLQAATMDIVLDSTAATEGFVAAVMYDTMMVSVLDVNITGTATESVGAELVVPEILEAQGGFTLGVVLDSTAPFDGQTIPAGSNVVASFDVMADGIFPMNEVVDFNFVDNTLNSPALNNIIVQGGLSIGAADPNFSLNNGQLTILPPPPDAITITGGSIAAGGTGNAEVRMSNQSGDVQGYVTAIGHPAGLVLEEINIDGTVAESVGAEFVVDNVLNGSGGGTLGVVLDFNAPFDGQVIPMGNNQLIANYVYSAVSHPTEPNPADEHQLSFVDGVLGSPALDNVLVVSGLSIAPGQDDSAGIMSALPVPLENTAFYCGVMDDTGAIVDPSGAPGDTVQMCFFWSDPDDNIGGFQLAVCFDCELEFVEGTWTIEGTILEAVGAEFVNHHVDNDPNDGDGCELIVGILLDALPPFDRQTVPPTAAPLEIGCIDVVLNGDCDTCYNVWFCDGANGRGTVAIDNVVVRNVTESVSGFTTHACQICIVAERHFIRGDCNFDGQVDIADPSTILAQQFQGYDAACDDACDANDDGKINLADVVYVLTWQFGFGPAMPAPFPAAGPDTTMDNTNPDIIKPELGCDGGINPC